MNGSYRLGPGILTDHDRPQLENLLLFSHGSRKPWGRGKGATKYDQHGTLHRGGFIQELEPDLIEFRNTSIVTILTAQARNKIHVS